MKQKLETAVIRKKFLSVDRDEARKTATGFSCKTLPFIKRKNLHIKKIVVTL
jgi:hypothetical protein